MSVKNITNETDLTQPAVTDLPPIVPNSELQLDGDISAYYTAWLDETLAQNIELLKKHIEERRIMSGFAHINVYTTQGAKAGRENIAQVKEYQVTRSQYKDEEKSARVAALRQWMAQYNSPTVTACAQYEIEADDAMSIRQRECIEQGIHSAIMSKDKDLNMVPGLHVDFDEYTTYDVPDDYGKIWLDESGSQKLCKGIGTAFFWAQMLMGDGADSIPGLPFLAAPLNNKYFPTKAVAKAQATLKNPKATAKQKASAKKSIAKRKGTTVGAVTAYGILKDCKNDKEAYARVLEAYKYHYGMNFFRFETWRGDYIEANASTMLIEQAKLLWMLRTRDDNVLKFMKERLT